MYEEFYGLHSKPFQLTPDPDFFFASSQHRRAQAYLDYGVMRNEGFVVVTGEIGAGKTTVVRGLLNGLEGHDIVAAQIVTTQLDADDLLRSVGAAFGVRVKDVSKSEVLMALEVFLVSQAGRGKRCLLIVDEAQNLELEALEELRMLSNFQFGKSALLQSFLVGQPEFREKLNHPHLLQLRQRVIAACHIGALDVKETQDYIDYRIKRAGGTVFPFAETDLSEKVFQLTGGIPRSINSFCDRLLLQGYLENRQYLTIENILKVKQDFSSEIQVFNKDAEDKFKEPLVESTVNGLCDFEQISLHDKDRGVDSKRNCAISESNAEISQRCVTLEEEVLSLKNRVDRISVSLHELAREGRAFTDLERF